MCLTVKPLVKSLRTCFHTVKKIWGDRADSGVDLSNWVLTQFECPLEVVSKEKRTARFPRFTSPLGGRENILLAESMASIK